MKNVTQTQLDMWYTQASSVAALILRVASSPSDQANQNAEALRILDRIMTSLRSVQGEPENAAV